MATVKASARSLVREHLRIRITGQTSMRARAWVAGWIFQLAGAVAGIPLVMELEVHLSPPKPRTIA